MITGDRCPRCYRDAIDRELDAAECQMPNCPMDEVVPTEPEEDPSPLARAIREARGGEAPRNFRGHA